MNFWKQNVGDYIVSFHYSQWFGMKTLKKNYTYYCYDYYLMRNLSKIRKYLFIDIEYQNHWLILVITLICSSSPCLLSLVIYIWIWSVIHKSWLCVEASSISHVFFHFLEKNIWESSFGMPDYTSMNYESQPLSIRLHL